VLRRLPARALRLAIVATLAFALLPASAATADVNQIVDLTFPVDDTRGLTTYTNDYFSPRSRGDHGATDIGGAKAYGVPVHAAVGGKVTWITGLDGALPSYGWMITIAGTDGRSYSYVHLGRQNGPASEAYAPGIRKGTVVSRGQHIGYVGHSGNASATWPHLHFVIDDPKVTDRQGTNRINPYYSLKDAGSRGDYPTVATVAGFTDVPVGHAHEVGIAWVAERQVTLGCRTNRYCPGEGVTRGQMATFLQRAGNLPDGGPHGFRDVPAGHPHARGIAAIKAAGITTGLGDGRFDPDGLVRRDQMATFLRNARNLPSSTRTYPDVPASSKHAGAIGAIGDAGITTGYPDGTYRPHLTVTRAQMATFLKAAFPAR
jgi:hypothetical protein